MGTSDGCASPVKRPGRFSAVTRLPFEGLLGLDILGQFRLRYDGLSQEVELTIDHIPTLRSRP